jgi:carbon-monoxide dehydrogenase small subunit
MEKKIVKLKVNGDEYEVLVKPNMTLLELIREELDLTGTKEACDEGQCGACTVIMEGRAVNSCLVPALEADGKEVTTIEGLAKGDELHPLQRAFKDKGALQCGFCTPGMIMSAKALLDSNPKPTDTEIKEAISGNICRCTGYNMIVEAIKSVISA